MAILDDPHLLLIAVTFVLAGFVKGVVGLGLPTVAVGLLVLAMPPAKAAALLILPSMVTNLWQLFAGPRFGAILRRLATMMAGIFVGSVGGAGLLVGDTAGRAVTWLGMALVGYAVLGLASIRFAVPPRWEPWLSPVIGVATGLATGATGVFVVPAVPYLQALGLEKDDLIQALGLSFTVSTVALAIGLARAGAFQVPDAAASLLALPPCLLGMVAGNRVRRVVSPAVFRTCFFAGLLLLGAHLALRTLL